MSLDNIPEGKQTLVDQVANAVEKTGKKIAHQVSNITDGKAEEVTEDAIQAAVDQALNMLQVAGQRVRQKNMNAERVTLEVEVSLVNLASIKITTDVPEKKNKN